MDSFLFLEGTKLRAVLIREGVSKNKNRWTKSILERVAELSNGVPFNFYDMSKKGDGTFLHHWEALRQSLPPGIKKLLPERLPGAQVGTISNAQLREGQDGKHEVVADIDVAESGSWFTEMFKRVQGMGKGLGVSIHVPQRSIQWKTEGDIREPTEVTNVAGYDAVSFPSAGGKLVPALEAFGTYKEGKTKMKFKNLVKRLLALVPEAKREGFKVVPPDTVDTVPSLLESHGEFIDGFLEAMEIEVPEDNRTSFLEGLISATPEKVEDSKPNKKKKGTGTPALEANGGDGNEPTPVSRNEFNGLSESVQAMLKANSISTLESIVKGSDLPESLAKFVKSHFTSVIEANGFVTEPEVKEFVKNLKSGIGSSENGNMLEGRENQDGEIRIGASSWNSGAEFIAAIDAMLDNQTHGYVGEGDERRRVDAIPSIQKVYQLLTGDFMLEGAGHYRQRGYRPTSLMEAIDWDELPDMQAFLHMRGANNALEASMTTATFPLLLSDRIHKAMLRAYMQQSLQWQKIARAETVTDFKTWRFLRTGEMENLPTVAEGGTYNDWGTAPNEEEITLAIQKRGGTFDLTWEAIRNDDTRKFREFPGKAARAAWRTLNKSVFDLIVGNTIYKGDAAALADATNHKNLIAAAYSFTNLKTMRKNMAKMRDLGNATNDGVGQGFGGQEMGVVRGKNVWCGSDLYDQIYEDLFSDGKPHLDVGTRGSGTDDNPSQPNILRSKFGFNLMEPVQEIDDTDADQYWLTADPSEAELVTIGFLDGVQEPRLFVQDLDRVGTFFDNEKIKTKIRHIYKAELQDFRGFQIGIP